MFTYFKRIRPNSPDGLCEQKAKSEDDKRGQIPGAVRKVEVDVPGSPYGLCGRKALLNTLTNSAQNPGAV